MIRKGVKASYHLDKEELKRRLLTKHNQRHVSHLTAHMDTLRGVETRGNLDCHGCSECSRELYPEMGTSMTSSAEIVPNSCCESTMSNRHSLLFSNNYNGLTESGNVRPSPGNGVRQLPSDRLSGEEWTCFLDEVGCSVRTPEFLGYLLDLEEEIRNDMLFELYDTTQQAEADIAWQEYCSLLSP